jgi:peptidoglycan/xylan/chitin deacetylase (PgdA/CDA1 family)
MLSGPIKRLLYLSGVLGLYHRVRNARTLTVIMFHRVLEPGDPRWHTCDPNYTIDAGLFAQCLRFFAAHYNIVSPQHVLEARRGESTLPERALLVTFDDGWSDNVDFALPRLRAAKVPGLVFVVADAVGRSAPFFQEQIVGAWRRGTLDTATLASAASVWLADLRTPRANDLPTLRQLIARIEGLAAPARAQLLAGLAGALSDDQRHMVSGVELQLLDAAGVGIGVHGQTHGPMTQVEDLDAELVGARRHMAARLPHRAAPATMSFPHGRYTAAIAERALQAGYELVFTSDPVLNRTSRGRGRPGWLLGRVAFEADLITDARGRFRPERLASHLFRRPALP